MAHKYVFGEIEGTYPGQEFENTQALKEAGIHNQKYQGIDGTMAQGCPSIILSGGYVDDLDDGDEIIYTGHGGNDDGKQVSDQSWDSPGNKALLVSEVRGLPVRVTRGSKHKSEYSPKSGYRYGGLYIITNHYEQRGKDGFIICRYKLKKLNPNDLDIVNEPNELPKGNKEPKKVKSTVSRTIRDTALSRSIKELYDYTCQICSVKIGEGSLSYAEGAHIRPLGSPHFGSDTPDNIICLCPNHHVMLDKGLISIDSKLNLIGIEGRLNVKENHYLNEDCLEYHRSSIYID